MPIPIRSEEGEEAAAGAPVQQCRLCGPVCRWRAHAPMMQFIASTSAGGSADDRGDQPSTPRPVATIAESAAKQPLTAGCEPARTCVADDARSKRHGREERASKQGASSQQRSSGGQRPYARPRVDVHDTQRLGESPRSRPLSCRPFFY